MNDPINIPAKSRNNPLGAMEMAGCFSLFRICLAGQNAYW